jgi:hypothetical protein
MIAAALAPALMAAGSAAAGAGTLGTVLSVGGTLLTGAMGFMGAMQESKNAKQQAKMEIAQSRENARRQRLENDALRGEQITRMGGSGVELLGSPMDFIVDDVGKGELTARDIEQRGRANASGLRYGANQSIIKGVGTLVSSGLKAGSAWASRPTLTPAAGGSKA